MPDQSSDLFAKYGVSRPGSEDADPPEQPKQATDLFSKYGVEAPKLTEPKVGTLETYGETIAQAVKQTPSYVAQAIEGKTPFSERTKADEYIEEAEKSQKAFVNRPGAKSEVLGG